MANVQKEDPPKKGQPEKDHTRKHVQPSGVPPKIGVPLYVSRKDQGIKELGVSKSIVWDALIPFSASMRLGIPGMFWPPSNSLNVCLKGQGNYLVSD